jgi:hypothetical protein
VSKESKASLPKKPNESDSKPGRKVGTIYFPRNPLKEVLAVPEAIWKQNAGNPFDMLDVAKAVDKSPHSSAFEQLLASSYRCGLTEGSPGTKVISLTPLGSVNSSGLKRFAVRSVNQRGFL